MTLIAFGKMDVIFVHLIFWAISFSGTWLLFGLDSYAFSTLVYILAVVAILDYVHLLPLRLVGSQLWQISVNIYVFSGRLKAESKPLLNIPSVTPVASGPLVHAEEVFSFAGKIVKTKKTYRSILKTETVFEA